MTDTQAKLPGSEDPATTPPPALPTSGGGSVADDGRGGVPHAGLRLAALIAALVALGVWNPWMLVVIMAIAAMSTLHEFGHYITAKRAGMKVTEFFLFFGPKVWSIKRGETEYGIKCIPAGAYVKIIGMSNLEEVPTADEARTYRQKSFGRRVSVAVAGSTMHFLLAVTLIFVALSVTGQPAGSIDPRVQDRQWTIGSISPGTGAAAAGLEPGDKIVQIDGRDVSTFQDLRSITKPLKGKTIPIAYVRDGERRTADVTLTPYYSWFVTRTVPGSGIAEAGIEAGDQIVSIDGKATRPTRDLGAELAGLEGETVAVEYERDDATRTVDVEIRSLILEGTEGYIGIGRALPADERLNPLEGALQAPKQFVDVLRLSVGSLGKFFTPGGISDFAGQVGNAREDRAETVAETSGGSDSSSAKLVDGAGPQVSENRLLSIFGLVRIGSEVGKVDPGALITLFAMINIFIGVFNLVPLLPFDGGHVMIAVYEKIQEKRLNRRRYFTDVARLLPLTYVVVFGLGLLFVSTLYLDIANPLAAS